VKNIFSDVEKTRIRHHLGYLNVEASQTFVLGTPAGVETQFLIEGAMNRVLPEAAVLAREMVAKCDAVEAQMSENQELLAVTQVDEIGVRQDEFEQLLKRYQYWRNALANILGTYANPFDKRFGAGGGMGVNVPVRH
jgi:hypothetical protein